MIVNEDVSEQDFDNDNDEDDDNDNDNDNDDDDDNDNDNGAARSELDDEAVAYIATLRALHTLRLSQVFSYGSSSTLYPCDSVIVWN